MPTLRDIPSCLSAEHLAQCSLIPSLSWGDVDMETAQGPGEIQEGWAGTRVAGPQPHRLHPQLYCPVLGFVHQSPGGGGTGQVGWSGELGSERETLSDRHHIWGLGQLPPGCYPGEGGGAPAEVKGRAHISPARALGLEGAAGLPQSLRLLSVAMQASDEKALL